MRGSTVLAACLLAFAVPAAAVQNEIDGYEETVTFDNVALDTGAFTATGAFDNFVSGGIVVATAFAHSGGQAYQGTSMGFIVEDQIDYSWPAVGGWVTGSGRIYLETFDFDPDSGTEISNSLSWLDDPFNAYLAAPGDPAFITRARYYSDSVFILDDLVLGLVDVGPGIPEPATWSLLITGFGLTSSAMRRRRFAA
jgi:hypothetical protein